MRVAYLTRRRLFFDHSQAVFQMQFTRPTVIVKPECRVGLLLRLHDDRARAQRMYGTARNVDQVSSPNLDPVEQFFRPVFVNCLFKMFAGSPRFQAEADFGFRRGMGDIPALSLAPWLPNGARSASSGCTWTESFSLNKNFASRGKRPASADASPTSCRL